MSSGPALSAFLIDAHLGARRDALALREPGRAMTYGELDIHMRRCAAALASLGVEPGDRVAMLMHDGIELASVLLGCLYLGALPLAVPTLLRANDVRAILVDARPRVALAHGDLAVLLDEVCEELPEPPQALVVGGQRSSHMDLLAVVAGTSPLRTASRRADGPALLAYTGSTLPRGVVHTMQTVRAAYHGWAEGILDLRPEDRVFSTVKLCSAYGLATGLLFPLLAGATACLLPERARPAAVFAGLMTFEPTVFAATPSLYGQLLRDFADLTAPRPGHFRSVRAAVSGAEPLPARLYQRVRRTFGVELLHGFGATESMHVFFSYRRGEARPGAAGRLVEGFSARLLDERGQPVPTPEIGALEVRGPSLAAGYWRRGSERLDVFRDEGWVATGDRFFVDGDGYYFHCGREDGLFNTSGRWVDPREVEATLVRHAAVWECAVIGIQDGDGLTVPAAYVVPNLDHTPSDELARELIDFVKREIAPYKYPRRLIWVRELPRRHDGEIQRWRLPDLGPHAP